MMEPLGAEGWTCAVKDLPKFKCNGCGYSGRADELLAEDDNETLYCPICETADWIWE